LGAFAGYRERSEIHPKPLISKAEIFTIYRGLSRTEGPFRWSFWRYPFSCPCAKIAIPSGQFDWWRSFFGG